MDAYTGYGVILSFLLGWVLHIGYTLWKKTYEDTKMQIALTSVNDCFKDKVKCHTCRCWLDVYDTYTVNTNLGKLKYCIRCKPPYDRYYQYFDGDVRYYVTKEIRVDKDGNELHVSKPTEKKNHT